MRNEHGCTSRCPLSNECPRCYQMRRSYESSCYRALNNFYHSLASRRHSNLPIVQLSDSIPQFLEDCCHYFRGRNFRLRCSRDCYQTYLGLICWRVWDNLRPVKDAVLFRYRTWIFFRSSLKESENFKKDFDEMLTSWATYPLLHFHPPDLIRHHHCRGVTHLSSQSELQTFSLRSC